MQSPGPTGLPADEVHVWQVALDQPAEVVASLRAQLSPDEQARADRFRFDLHRAHFTVSRGSLREILGGYLALDACGVTFEYGPYGKPELAQTAAPAAPRLRFNLAHSHGIALVAVTIGRAVGVDLEQVRPNLEFERIIGRYFSEAERAEFLALAEHHRFDAFFRGWTRKEAYMKAIGLGFAMPLDRFSVSLGATEARLLNVIDRPDDPGRWVLKDLDSGPGFRAALAVEGAGWSLQSFTHRPDGGARPAEAGRYS